MEFLYWLLLALAVIIFVYVAVRFGSIAYYRTRAEHFDRVLRKLGNGERDAKN